MILDKFIDSHNYYVVISSRGVLDPSLQVFKPPSVNFEEKWGEQNAFNIVYSSKHFDIYERVG